MNTQQPLLSSYSSFDLHKSIAVSELITSVEMKCLNISSLYEIEAEQHVRGWTFSMGNQGVE